MAHDYAFNLHLFVEIFLKWHIFNWMFRLRVLLEINMSMMKKK